MPRDKFPTEHPDKTTPRYLDGFFGAPVQTAADATQGELRLAAVQKMARDAWSDIFKFHTRAMADESRTELQRLMRSAEFARRRMDSVNKSFNEALETAGRSLQQTQAQLDAYMTPPADGRRQIHSESRFHIRELPPERRAQFVRDRMAAGDLETAQAVVAAPDYLTELHPEIHQKLRREYLAKVAPEALARHERLSTVNGAAAEAFTAMSRHANALIDFDAAEQAAKFARDPEAA